ncbi:Major tail protein V [Sphingomonas aurantiaca]|uniref:Major tail protein V n=1 Tax=Sphingomonas aurantiaca TaxID=185949 RepID=A0A5E7ZNR1_9SPHN|nr:phage tail tube protein [Sphingomonas aurantiaca]VVT20302.1 Major tail protein V [Sphingomonas aurantiaca]
MPATVAATDIGFLTILSKKTAATTFVAFAEITELTLPELARDSVEYTHYGSPDKYREFKPGLADAGEVGIVYNLVPGLLDDATIATHLATNTVEAWRVTFPNGATLDFFGFATAHGRAAPMDDKMTGSATFKISGKPVVTPAA